MATILSAFPKKRAARAGLRVLSCVFLLLSTAEAQMVTGSKIPGFNETMGVTGDAPKGFAITLVESSAPGNILWPGEKLTVKVRAEGVNFLAAASGTLDVIRYGTRGIPNDIWTPQMFRIAEEEPLLYGFDFLLAADAAHVDFELSPAIPETKGAYALVLDLGEHGRHFLASVVRTFKPEGKPPQYPQLCMDVESPAVLSRLGVAPNRVGIPYHPTTLPDFEERYQRHTRLLREYRDAGLPVTIEIGGGDFFGATQPLGRPRPHLDENGRMRDTKFDLAWLPEYDADFAKFTKRLIAEFGWPRGPVNGIMLWNEPWQGISISGWGADMPRYLEMFKVMAVATREACRENGLEVLIGGCDSTSNTLDLLFADGTTDWLEHLDFCSIHYQGMFPPSTLKMWMNREHPNGRVRIWDTESWVANTDDRVAAVVAGNLSTGHDRAVGVYGGNVAQRDPKTGLMTAWPVAAAVGAANHFIGERKFDRLLFRNGLPWVMVFNGRNGDIEDSTLVVVGDLGAVFGHDNMALRTARGIAELEAKKEIFEKLQTLPVDSPERFALLEKFNTPEPLSEASMELFLFPPDKVKLFDFYGNPVSAQEEMLDEFIVHSTTVPLDGRGFFLRGDGSEGAFAALCQLAEKSFVKGVMPLAIVAHDFQEPVENNPPVRLSIKNVSNGKWDGYLQLAVPGFVFQGNLHVSLRPGETREYERRAVHSEVSPLNCYQLTVRFISFAPDDSPFSDFLSNNPSPVLFAEDLHVNLIHRRTINVDGDLDDWRGCLPQILSAPGSGPSLTEAAWLPFEKFPDALAGGHAEGYVAHDDDYFYFAARIADTTPHPGMPRFETLDEDEFFYPEISTLSRIPDARTAQFMRNDPEEPQELQWPEGVRRYTYRKGPVLPSGGYPRCDNVQLAFNVLPLSEKAWADAPAGTMPRYAVWPTTDYEYALNPVAEQYGGGVEIWRLQHPGMPHKHHYPRQAKSGVEGAVKDGKLVIKHDGATRIVEAAIPWSEIPHVKQARDEGRTIKFAWRVNDDASGACLETARRRSVAKRSGNGAFTPDWVEHWDNEVEFAFEK